MKQSRKKKTAFDGVMDKVLVLNASNMTIQSSRHHHHIKKYLVLTTIKICSCHVNQQSLRHLNL